MRNARPDLLLLDMMMPEMSGEDVIKIMKQDPLLQDIPVILITARASDEDRILGLQMGADDYLPKPIFAAELRLRVHNLLSRLQLLRDIENGSKDEKFAQLGSLFGELSHELKNVMVGTASLRGINPNDSKSLVEALGLSKKSAKALSKALMAPLSSKDRSELLERLDPGADDELRQQRWMLRFDVTDLDLNFEQLEPLWNELKELHSEKMLLAISTIKLFTEHKILHEQMRMARDITTSVLNYTRDDSGHVTCCIDKVWTDITRLTQNKQRKTKAKIDVQIPESTIVPMRYSSCMQVLLNLTMNALDAVAEIDEMNERWIKLQAYQDESGVFLQISNAGKPIPKETQKQLFERGFSTKGDSGNGIGLYVSRRLMKDTGGELSYDEYSQSPCFKLFFPMDEQAASQMSLTSAVADSLAS